ncbi:hypothetical protein [Pseudomonas cichorii]|nr:hypothetical protein [Pseudomonas cichorii]MBX8603456.1 hypothetical protein [Pseudomonas cichorii]QVE15108.1 hypothetical protein KGD89_14430 [Pseudomonas cichorii]SDO62716.1 hypothetical protein SAMN05216599_1112 [Pseudomonas cichorii]
MKKQKFSMQIAVTPENQGLIDFYQQWSRMIPTLYFLDLCTISHIKDSLERDPGEGSPEPQTLAWLRENDLSHNGFSYLPALMEKASDTKSKFDVNGLIEEAARDLTALNSFFQHARVVEDINLASQYVADLKGIHPEILGPRYHDFLEYVNGLELFNAMAPGKRFKAAEAICEHATSLGIDKGHPLVLASVACVYGCVAAKKVLKFKKNPAEFSSSNALGDVQVIQRVGKLTKMVEQTHRGFARTGFVTDDRYLQDFYDFFFVNEVASEIGENTTSTKYEMTIQAYKLFPDLFDENREPKGDTENVEVLKLYALFGFPN